MTYPGALTFKVVTLPLVAAAALNDRGQVLGYLGRVPFLEAEGQPVIWQDGRLTQLGTPPERPAVNLVDINNVGESLAHAGRESVDPTLISARSVPFFHSGKAWISLGEASPTVRWTAINDRGVLLGVSKDGFVVTFRDDRVIKVARTDGYVQPTGLNSACHVLLLNSQGGVLWNGFALRKLGISPYAINDRGDIAGEHRAFIPAGQSDVRTLGRPDGFSHAQFSRNRRSLNDRGLIVGEASGPRRTAAVWVDELPYDLNKITEMAQGAHLERALAINNRNEILAFQRSADGATRIVLLVPIS